MNKHTTREAWLTAAVELLRPLFREQDATIPKKVRASCGWPGAGSINKCVGECWNTNCSEGSYAEVFISPVLAEPLAVLDTLVHEIVHAVVGLEAKHGKVFGTLARAVGLVGKMPSSEAGEELQVKLLAMSKKLGSYPHSILRPGKRLKGKPNCRLLKAACPKCGYVVRVTRKWLDEAGAPICPTCGIAFEEETKEE